jgi:molybdate transport system substrate-binding protein
MSRNVIGLLAIALTLLTPARADTLKVIAAGSLRAAMTELLHRFPLQSDSVDSPEFGSSGLMRQKIENGAAVDVFASADMEQARQLAAVHPERLVILFARNTLCAISRSNLGLDQTNLLDKLLDPSVRIATSTPGSDPLGTYSWEVFARAEALKPGARASSKRRPKNWSVAGRRHLL